MADRTILYVSSAGTAEVLTYSFDGPAARLEPVARTAVPASLGASPTSMPMALSPDRRRLHVAVRSIPFRITTFAIEPRTGALEQKATASLADNMAYLSTDRAGRYLFAASYVSGRLSVHAITEDGEVREPPIQLLDTPPKAHCILADPTNRWVLATSLGGDVVLRYGFDAATGRLTALKGPMRTRPGAGPRHLVFDPAGRFVYLLNELDAHVTVYAFDSQLGALEERQSVPMLAMASQSTFSAADIHITPDARFLYASERETSSIAGFSIDAGSGQLTRILTCTTEASPRGFAIMPCGRFLLVAGQLSNQVSAYAIDKSDGRLTKILERPAGSNPNWIECVMLPPTEADDPARRHKPGPAA